MIVQLYCKDYENTQNVGKVRLNGHKLTEMEQIAIRDCFIEIYQINGLDYRY